MTSTQRVLCNLWTIYALIFGAAFSIALYTVLMHAKPIALHVRSL